MGHDFDPGFPRRFHGTRAELPGSRDLPVDRLPDRVGTDLPSRAPRRQCTRPRDRAGSGHARNGRPSHPRRRSGPTCPGLPRQARDHAQLRDGERVPLQRLGQGGGERHKNDLAIAAYRNQWLDKLIVDSQVEAGRDTRTSRGGRVRDVARDPRGQRRQRRARGNHAPDVPRERVGGRPDDEDRSDPDDARELEHRIAGARPAHPRPRCARPLVLYGSKLEDADLAPIPECDMPAGHATVDALARRLGGTRATGRAR